jgi:hypothetical protein
MQAYGFAALAAVLPALGRTDEAREHADEAFRLLMELGALDDGDVFVRLVYAEHCLARGDRPAARKAILASRDRLLDRAAKISAPAWRNSFLRRVPENARTLALADALARPSTRPS